MSGLLVGRLVAAALLAQAEPAPPEPPPPQPTPAPAPLPPPTLTETPPDFAIGLGGGGARRLGESAQVLSPRNGFEFSTRGLYTYARTGPLELAAGVGFSYQRFRQIVAISVPASGSTFDAERTFSYYDFELQQTVALALGFVRPWLGVGAGFSMGYFSSREPDLAPGEKRATRPALSAHVGVDFDTGRNKSRAGVAAGVAFLFRSPQLGTSDGRVLPVFGDRANIRFTFLQPF